MKKLFILGLLALCAGCQHRNTYQASFYNSDGKKYVENGEFYLTKNESPYFYIQDEQIRKEISECIIDSIEFNIGDKKFIAKPVRLIYSDRNPNPSDFLFPVDNNSRKIIYDTIDNKEMFTLVSKKTNILDLIQNGKIIPQHLQ